jgi:single-strand DNA-binding protein
MRDVNKVVLTGRLTKDVEVKTFDNGRGVLSGTVAVNRSVKKGDAYETETYFGDFKFFVGNPAVAEKFKKGIRVTLTGELKTDKFTGQDGTTKYKDYILVEELNLVDRTSSEELPI